MKHLHELKEMLCRELEEFSKKGELSAGALETIHKLTDTIKNIDKIEMLEGDDGYSRDGEWEARGIYDRGSSYARRGSHYVRGHYSRDDGMDYRHRDYSRDDAKDHMMDKLEEMMGESTNSKEREALKKCMNAIERA